MAKIGDLFYEVSARNVQSVQRQLEALQNRLNRLGGGAKPTTINVDSSQVNQAASSFQEYARRAAEAATSTRPLSNSSNGLKTTIRGLRNEIAGTRNEFIALGTAENTTKTQADAVAASMARLKNEALQLASGLSRDSAEFRQLTTAAATAQRTIAATSGQMSRLGLASQSTLATQSALRSSLLTVGFAANSSVAGMALLTAGFASADAGAKSFLATMSVIAPLVIFGASVAAAAVEITTLERAQIDLLKVTSLTQGQARILTTEFQELSRELGISTQAILETSGAAGRLGIDGVENLNQFTETITKLALATDVVGEQGAEALARFLFQTNTAQSELGETASNLADVLNELGNQLPTTAGAVLEFTRQTGQLGSFAGVAQEEILGMSAGLDSLGLRAEGAGNPLAKLFATIQKQARNGAASLEIYAALTNQTTDEFANLAQTNIDDAFREIAKGLSEVKAQGGDVNQVLDALGITELRQARLLRVLSGGYDTFSKAVELATDETRTTGSVQREVDKVTESLSVQVKGLGQDFKVLFQGLGNDLLPAFKGSISVLRAVTDSVNLVDVEFRGLIATLTVITPLLTRFFGPTGAIIGGSLALLQLGKAILDTSDRSIKLRNSMGELTQSVSNIQRPSEVSSEGIQRISEALTGPGGLESASAAVASFMGNEAAQAFAEYAKDARDTAISTVESIDFIFSFLAQRSAEAIQLQIQAQRLSVDRATVNVSQAREIEEDERNKLSTAREQRRINQQLERQQEIQLGIADTTAEINRLNALDEGPGLDAAGLERLAALNVQAADLKVQLTETSERVQDFFNRSDLGAVSAAEESLRDQQKALITLEKQYELTQQVAEGSIDSAQLRAAYALITSSTEDLATGVKKGAFDLEEFSKGLDENVAKALESTGLSLEKLNKTLGGKSGGAGIASNFSSTTEATKELKGAYELLSEEVAGLNTQLKDAIASGADEDVIQGLRNQVIERQALLKEIDSTTKALLGEADAAKESQFAKQISNVSPTVTIAESGLSGLSNLGVGVQIGEPISEITADAAELALTLSDLADVQARVNVGEPLTTITANGRVLGATLEGIAGVAPIISSLEPISEITADAVQLAATLSDLTSIDVLVNVLEPITTITADGKELGATLSSLSSVDVIVKSLEPITEITDDAVELAATLTSLSAVEVDVNIGEPLTTITADAAVLGVTLSDLTGVVAEFQNGGQDLFASLTDLDKGFRLLDVTVKVFGDDTDILEEKLKLVTRAINANIAAQIESNNQVDLSNPALVKLRAQYEAIQGEIENNITFVESLTGTLDKVDDIANIAANAIAEVFAFDASSASGVLGSISSIAGALSGIPVIGGIAGAVGGIAGAIGSLLGGGGESKEERARREAFESLQKSIFNSVSSGFSEAFQVAADGGNALESLEESLDKLIFDASREALIESLLVEGELKEAIDAYTAAVNSGDIDLARAWAEHIRTQLPEVAREIEEAADIFRDKVVESAENFSQSAVDLFNIDLDSIRTDNFIDNWKDSLRQATVDSLLEAFLTRGAFSQIGQAINDALADGFINVRERVDIEALIDASEEEVQELLERLEQFGLIDPDPSGGLTAFSEKLEDLRAKFKEVEEARDNFTIGENDSGVVTFIPDFEEELATIERQIERITETIRASLGVTVTDLAGDITNLINQSGGDFTTFSTNFEDSIKGSVRNGIIQGVLSSEAVTLALGGLSDSITEALLDGVVDELELEKIAAERRKAEGLIEPIFETIDDLDLLGESARKAAQSLGLLNAPSGFRIEPFVQDTLNASTTVAPLSSNAGATNITTTENFAININAPVFGVDDLNNKIQQGFNEFSRNRQLRNGNR